MESRTSESDSLTPLLKRDRSSLVVHRVVAIKISSSRHVIMDERARKKPGVKQAAIRPKESNSRINETSVEPIIAIIVASPLRMQIAARTLPCVGDRDRGTCSSRRLPQRISNNTGIAWRQRDSGCKFRRAPKARSEHLLHALCASSHIASPKIITSDNETSTRRRV